MDKIMVFIPMYNCEKQVIRVLKQFDKKIIKYISEIVLVNNRSTDNTEATVVDFVSKNKIGTKVTVLRNEANYNLGGSHKVAFNYAKKNRYDYLVVLHGDDQGNISDLAPYLKNEEYKQYDCFLGSRFAKGSVLKGYSKFRIFGNRVYNILFSLSMGKRISDLGSGLNMYKVSALSNNYFHKYPDRLTFNCYMLLATKSYNQKTKFFPISWREDDQVSNVKMISQAWVTFKLAINYLFKGTKFLELEHREIIVESYKAKKVYCNESSDKNE